MLELFTGWLFTQLDFFASGLGILLIGATALLTILLWDWRVTLAGVLVIQVGVAILAGKVHGLTIQWASVQIMVTGLALLMLLLSAHQVQPALRQQRPGSWPVRLSAAMLLLISWQFLDVDLALPIIAPQIAQLCLWLALCGLVLLGLSDTPFFTGVALLLWFMPIQAFIEILLPQYRLFVLIGMIELLVALACSYLMLAQRLPVSRSRPLRAGQPMRNAGALPLLLGTPINGVTLPTLINGNGKHAPLNPLLTPTRRAAPAQDPPPNAPPREPTGEHDAITARRS